MNEKVRGCMKGSGRVESPPHARPRPATVSSVDHFTFVDVVVVAQVLCVTR